jgi:hypothetical protein
MQAERDYVTGKGAYFINGSGSAARKTGGLPIGMNNA